MRIIKFTWMADELILNNITCVSLYLLSLVCFSNPAKRNLTANKWFGLAMFSAGSMLLDAMIYASGAAAQYADLILFNELSRFLIAPALYLSIVHFTSPDKRFNHYEYLHLIPFALFFLFMMIGPIGREFFQAPPVFSRIMAHMVSIFPMGQLLVYWLMSWHKLKRHKLNIRLINSSTEDVDLAWLQNVLFGIAVMLLAWLVGTFFKNHAVQLIVSACYLIGLFLTGYSLLAQPEVYPFEQPELQIIAEVINPPVKPVKQRLNSEQSTALKARLTATMITRKIYLDNELSLPTLAKVLNVSTHDLSYLCNDVLGTSFFKLVNGYRVEEAKRLMLSAQHLHLNLLGIAYSAGFNSKTTFNTAFKNETGLSPSQFISQSKNVNQDQFSSDIAL